MYQLASESIEVECGVAEAFAYACNLEHFPDWFPGVIRIASVDDRPHAQTGKVYRESVAVPGRGIRQVGITVVAAERDQLFATEGDLPALIPRMEMQFATVSSGRCRIHWAMYSRRRHGLGRFIVLPLAAFVMRRRAPRGLLNLKAVLEAADSCGS